MKIRVLCAIAIGMVLVGGTMSAGGPVAQIPSTDAEFVATQAVNPTDKPVH